MSARRIVKLAVAVAAVALFIPLAPGSASADPGGCGVRNGTTGGPHGGLLYIVRNQCSFVITVKVWLIQGGGRYSNEGCKPIAGKGLGYFHDILITPTWEVHNC
ncbi:hypothetical protein ABZ897_24265 [Nonomuraea sp. NPDC046802]|uniref:hypothetical protein n=1 Tax=Nonomuraea sp. NPDC046802 TaxID=3154919 RepID=UPI0033F10BEB